MQMSWAETEFETADFGDKRLKKRISQVATSLAENSVESIPSACRGWQETKAAYRFFDHNKVTSKKIFEAHAEATRVRLSSQKRVLLLQDTSELDYSNHFSKEGMGYLNTEHRKGLLIHPLLAVTEERLPLGIVSMAWWSREKLGQDKRCEERAIEDKETYRWLLHYREGNKLAKEIPGTHFVVIGDRESDIYELLLEASDVKKNEEVGADIIVRSSHDRVVRTSSGKTGKLRDEVSKSQVLGEIQFELKPRIGQKKRLVTQEIRALRLTISPTQRRGERGELKPFEITVVHAREKNPPEGCQRVEWFLLSTIEINHFSEACSIINCYLARWDIELFFKALKSGCAVEQIQLQEEQRFFACLALYMVIAWRITFLTNISRTNPELCCTEFLSDTEWRIAYLVIKKKQPKAPPDDRRSYQNGSADGWISCQEIRWTARHEKFMARINENKRS